MDTLFGRLIDGRYEIKPLPIEAGTESPYLGQGGMGKVYLAYDNKLQSERAIKFLTFDGPPTYTAAVTERFRREAIVAARLGAHRNVVTIYDHVEAHDDVPAYIVMELARGRPLSKLLQEVKPLDPERAVNLAIGICAGVGAAHRQQIVHRDVKPKNVIVCQEFDVELAKVIDFGIAKTDEVDWTQLTRFGDKMGTYAYMSPEQWFDPSAVDVRADVYSLGCLLYEALAGRQLFVVQTPEEYPEKHRVEKPAKFAKTAKIPIQVETVVLRALAKSPNDRQADANRLAEELTEALASVAESKRKRLDLEKQRKEKAEAERLRTELEYHKRAAEEAARKLAEQEQLVLSERTTFYATIAELRSKLASTPVQRPIQPSVLPTVPLEPPVQSTVPLEPPVQSSVTIPIQPPVPVPVPRKRWPALRTLMGRRLVPIVLGLLAGLLVEILLKDWAGWGISLASLSAAQLVLAGLIILTSIAVAVLLWFGAGSKIIGSSSLRSAIQMGVFALVGFQLTTMGMDALSEWQVSQGLNYSGQQHYDEAINSYNAAMQLNPHNVRVYINRGNAHFSKNQYEAAISDFDQAIRMEPDKSTAYSARGRVYYSQGGYSRALADYNEALRLDPQDVTAYKNRGDFFFYMKQYGHAITDYTEAMRLDPAHSDTYLADLKKAKDLQGK